MPISKRKNFTVSNKTHKEVYDFVKEKTGIENILHDEMIKFILKKAKECKCDDGVHC